MTQLTVPSVSGATLYIFAQNPPMALKSQPRPHPIEPLALGANGVHVILLCELEALHCLPVSQLQTSRYMPAFPLILGKAFLAKEMPLQPVFIVGVFWFTDCFCVNHPVTGSLPSDTQTKSITSNGHISHCAHPSDKQMETLRGSDLLRLTLQKWWCWGPIQV